MLDVKNLYNLTVSKTREVWSESRRIIQRLARTDVLETKVLFATTDISRSIKL